MILLRAKIFSRFSTLNNFEKRNRYIPTEIFELMDFIQFFKEIYPQIVFFALFTFTSLQWIVTKKLLRKDKIIDDKNTNPEIGFSIVISARNEESCIDALLASLSKLNYPKNLYEIIIVDDQSSDSTSSKIKSASNINNLRFFSSDEKRFTGKRGALQMAIENAKFDFIAITDADCVLPPNWLQHFNRKILCGYDFVFGLLKFDEENYFLSRYNQFDLYKNLSLKILTTGINLPHSATGANLAFNKKIFFEVGGYSKTRETLSGDDDLLLREFVKRNAKIGVILDSENAVSTISKKTFKAFSNQRARHTHSSFHYLFPQKLFLTLWHLAGIISQYIVLYFWFSPYFLIPGLYKFFYEIYFAKYFSKKLGYKIKLIDLILFPFIYEILLIVNYFRALSKKYHW